MASNYDPNENRIDNALERAFQIRKRLTVAEIERLAKAGVTVNLADIDIVPEKEPYYGENKALMDPLIHRLRLAFPITGYGDQRFSHISAVPIGGGAPGVAIENVAVTVVTVHGNAVLLEDEFKTFPSEALMAKLHLLLETEPRRPGDMSKWEGGDPRTDARVNPVQVLNGGSNTAFPPIPFKPRTT